MLPNKEKIPYAEVLDIGENTLLIDIRSEEAFKAFQIPNAINLCVYELAFIDKVTEIVEDYEDPIVVYGEDDVYRGADYAYTKLNDAGFLNVEVLKRGICGWLESKGLAKPEEPKIPEGKRYVSLEKSRVIWYGRNFFSQHSGRVPINSGNLKINANGEIACAEIEVDLERMTCENLTVEEGRNMLVDHLKSSDFFLTNKFPTASFVFKSATPIANASESSTNWDIEGEMIIRGVRHPIRFPAMLYSIENGFGLQAQFDLNRTYWNVVYGSGRIFERLGMHVVSDLISLQVQLIFDE